MEVNTGKLDLAKMGSGQDTRVNTPMLLKTCQGLQNDDMWPDPWCLPEKICFKMYVPLLTHLDTTRPFPSVKLALTEACCRLSLKVHSGHRIVYLNCTQSEKQWKSVI